MSPIVSILSSVDIHQKLLTVNKTLTLNHCFIFKITPEVAENHHYLPYRPYQEQKLCTIVLFFPTDWLALIDIEKFYFHCQNIRSVSCTFHKCIVLPPSTLSPCWNFTWCLKTFHCFHYQETPSVSSYVSSFLVCLHKSVTFYIW